MTRPSFLGVAMLVTIAATFLSGRAGVEGAAASARAAASRPEGRILVRIDLRDLPVEALEAARGRLAGELEPRLAGTRASIEVAAPDCIVVAVDDLAIAESIRAGLAHEPWVSLEIDPRGATAPEERRPCDG